MPTICVIVPVYKVEPYIQRCVDSILMQTYRNFELILVDDGSPDRCGAICDEYALQDSRVHVIHQENGGLSAARNAGIDWAFANSDSQWLTFIDSDDWVHPEMLERLLENATEKKTNVSICGYTLTEGEMPVQSDVEYHSQVWEPELFFVKHNTNAVVAWGKLYRKECFSEIRYPVGKIHEDEFTTYKILFAEKAIAVTDMPMYYYFQNASGITKSDWSPKRLDVVQALRGQAVYFRKHGYMLAYKHSALWYVTMLTMQRENVAQSELSTKEKRKYTRYVMRRLRAAVWEFGALLWKEGKYIYAEAYPVLRTGYEFVKKIRNRV